MIADFPPAEPAATITAPAEADQMAKRRSGARERDRPRRGRAAAALVGTVILLNDGTPCEIVAVTSDTTYCRPIGQKEAEQ